MVSLSRRMDRVFLELFEVLGRHQDSGTMTVDGHGHTLMMIVDSADELGEVGFHLA
jgi:hypothetical protein